MMAKEILIAVGAIIVAYLIGSINFAVIFSNIFTGKDVRKSGSGNAGATNVMRTAGVLPGILTFLFDALKGFAGAYIGLSVFRYLFETTGNSLFTPIYGAYISYLFVMVGHILPIFFQFKGGKGIATSVGGFAVCCWPAIVIGLSVFALSLIITKIVSISSLAAALCVAIFAAVFVQSPVIAFTGPTGAVWPQIVMAVMASLIVFLTHRANIVRLIKGREKKITIGRSKK